MAEDIPNKAPLSACTACGCEDFYVEKNFPKKIGISIIAVAAVLSFWTYHISLIVAAIIDALIYKFVASQLVCYRCRTVYRDTPIPSDVVAYDLHKAELYNYGSGRPIDTPKSQDVHSVNTGVL